MTHPDYRHQGLAAKLMNFVIDNYSDKFDFLFLLSNGDAAGFYPKFGFTDLKESSFRLDVKPGTGQSRTLKKLDISKPETLDWMYKRAINRKPVSNIFGVENGQNLLMFHLIYVLSDHIYYLEDEDVIVICKKDGRILHLYDLISSTDVQFDKIVDKISDIETEQIIFHFTPDLLNVNAESFPLETDDVFYVKTGSITFNSNFIHPKTSEA